MIQQFKPIIEEVGTKFPATATVKEFATEPMLHSCSLGFARDNCGPLTKSMLDACDFSLVNELCNKYGLHIVIDSRVSMLMPGMYPSIPGWHCDAIPRSDYNSQPDFSMLHPNAGHYIASMSTHEEGVSNTELITQRITMVLDNEEPIWQQVHSTIEEKKKVPPGVASMFMPDGQWIYFNPYTIHRASPAKRRGWRNWVRLSMYHNPPMNKISNRTQIYILSEENGW